ncbi:MAG: hypothetical protein LBD02_02925 [Christensenellaceae bacterium]|jgi:hypothetical protein|nr:hypothetical protein [Christensenellaceae bacterium]
MKCPSCGVWNRSHYKVCFHCGAELKPEVEGEETSPASAGERPAEEAYSYGESNPSNAKEKRKGFLASLFGGLKKAVSEKPAETPWGELPEAEESAVWAADAGDEGLAFGMPGEGPEQDAPEAEKEGDEPNFKPFAVETKPAQNLSSYENKLDLFDYSNWGDEDETAVPGEPQEEQAEAEQEPRAQSEEPGAQEPRTKRITREVLVPARAVSRDELLESAQQPVEIDEQIINAINTGAAPGATASPGAALPRQPRRMLSMTTWREKNEKIAAEAAKRRAERALRAGPEPITQPKAREPEPEAPERADPAALASLKEAPAPGETKTPAARKPEPEKAETRPEKPQEPATAEERPAQPEPEVIPLGARASAQRVEIAQSAEPFDLKDEIQPPKRVKSLAASIDEAIERKRQEAAPPPPRIDDAPLNQREEKPAVPRRLMQMRELAAPQKAAEAEREAPVEDRPEWAQRALEQMEAEGAPAPQSAAPEWAQKAISNLEEDGVEVGGLETLPGRAAPKGGGSFGLSAGQEREPQPRRRETRRESFGVNEQPGEPVRRETRRGTAFGVIEEQAAPPAAGPTDFGLNLGQPRAQRQPAAPQRQRQDAMQGTARPVSPQAQPFMAASVPEMRRTERTNPPGQPPARQQAQQPNGALRDQGFGSTQAPQSGVAPQQTMRQGAQPGAMYPQGTISQPTARRQQQGGLRDQGFGSAQAPQSGAAPQQTVRQGARPGAMYPQGAIPQPTARQQQGGQVVAAPRQGLRDEGFGPRQSQRQAMPLGDPGFANARPARQTQRQPGGPDGLGSRRVPAQAGASMAQTGREPPASTPRRLPQEGFSSRQEFAERPGVRRPSLARESADLRREEGGSGLIRQHSSRNQEEEPKRGGLLSLPLKNSALLRNPLQFWLILVGVLLLLGLLIFGVVKGIGAIGSAIAGASPATTTTPQPSGGAEEANNVQTGTVNGQPGRIITFTGSDGDVIYIPEPLNQNVTIVGGVGIFKVEDSRLIGERIVEEAVEVTLQPVLRSASGKDEALPPIHLQVTPPDAALEIIAPAGGREEVSLMVYQIQLRVMVGSKVTINGEDVSESISTQADTAGILARNVELRPIGDNDIEIEVSNPGFKTVRKTVQLYLEKRAIPISLDVGTPSISNEGTVTISGKVGEGATIKVNSPTAGEIVLNSNGSFSFKAKLSRFGENIIEIVASKNGEEDAPFYHAVTYNPDVDSYTSSAYVMPKDLAELQNYKNKARPFRFDGQIESVLLDEPYTFRFNAGSESAPKIIVMEMIEGKRPEIGTKYKIYAEVLGKTDDGLPLVRGRFYYKIS